MKQQMKKTSYKKLYLVSNPYVNIDHQPNKSGEKNKDNQVSHIKLGDVIIHKSNVKNAQSKPDPNNKHTFSSPKINFINNVPTSVEKDQAKIKSKANSDPITESAGMTRTANIREQITPISYPVQSMQPSTAQTNVNVTQVPSLSKDHQQNVQPILNPNNNLNNQPSTLEEPIADRNDSIREELLQREQENITEGSPITPEIVDSDRERLEQQFNSYKDLLEQSYRQKVNEKNAEALEQQQSRDRQWLAQMGKIYEQYQNSLSQVENENVHNQISLQNMEEVIDYQLKQLDHQAKEIEAANNRAANAARAAAIAANASSASSTSVPRKSALEEKKLLRELTNDRIREFLDKVRHSSNGKRKKQKKHIIKKSDSEMSVSPPRGMPDSVKILKSPDSEMAVSPPRGMPSTVKILKEASDTKPKYVHRMKSGRKTTRKSRFNAYNRRDLLRKLIQEANTLSPILEGKNSKELKRELISMPLPNMSNLANDTEQVSELDTAIDSSSAGPSSSRTPPARKTTSELSMLMKDRIRELQQLTPTKNETGQESPFISPVRTRSVLLKESAKKRASKTKEKVSSKNGSMNTTCPNSKKDQSSSGKKKVKRQGKKKYRWEKIRAGIKRRKPFVALTNLEQEELTQIPMKSRLVKKKK